MKRIGKEPRLLPNVMEAIVNLKEKHGSTPKQIIEHIGHLLRKNRDGSRNITMQVRRALEHGLHSGLIKHRGGKYTLGLDKKDYAIFRRFRHISDPGSDCNTCKRGRRRGRRGRRGRRRRSRRRRGGRRRTLSNEEGMSEDSESGRSTIGGTPEPTDRSRRRRRKRKGRRRRGRRRAAAHETNSEKSVSEDKESKPAVTPEKGRSDHEKIDYQQKAGNSQSHHHQERNQERNHQERNDDREDAEECDNPECLCNIKREDDSPRCMSRENNYYNDSYLN